MQEKVIAISTAGVAEPTMVRGKVVRSKLARNVPTFLMVFGPGLIVMEADDDAGAVSTYVQAGRSTAQSCFGFLVPHAHSQLKSLENGRLRSDGGGHSTNRKVLSSSTIAFAMYIGIGVRKAHNPRSLITHFMRLLPPFRPAARTIHQLQRLRTGNAAQLQSRG
jgi:hypothetical protein